MIHTSAVRCSGRIVVWMNRSTVHGNGSFGSVERKLRRVKSEEEVCWMR